jgi:YesN/AraC family two-component response regulator
MTINSWNYQPTEPASARIPMGRKEKMDRKSILLVDDEQLILESICRELTSEPLDFDVGLATSGEEAIDKITSSHWDLVVTDLLMPGLDGFQVLKAAKRRDPNIMVIILTGYADMQSAIDALRLGADDFLQKPCDTDELLYRMSNCFSKQGLQRTIGMYEKILPVCSYCKRIRDDQPGELGKGQWYSLEEFFVKVKGVNCSHGCCPDCFAKLMPGIALGMDNSS